MCIKPGKLTDGTEIACRKCWQCEANRVNDWVGRCIAEKRTSVDCHAITLTYGRDQYGAVEHPNALILTYSDVQKYFKKLRFNGYPLRYIVVGEYGTKKGRAHWHVIAFWKGNVPPHELDRDFHEAHWEHGFSFWTKPGYEAFRYNVKYINKDIGELERQAHLAMSKKPPLGSDYFRMEAERWVEAGLAPRDLIYTIEEARRSSGEKHRFMLRGKTADIFLSHFVETWKKRRPGRHLPYSELLDEWMDMQVREQPGYIEPTVADDKSEYWRGIEREIEINRFIELQNKGKGEPWPKFVDAYGENAAFFQRRFMALPGMEADIAAGHIWPHSVWPEAIWHTEGGYWAREFHPGETWITRNDDGSWYIAPYMIWHEEVNKWLGVLPKTDPRDPNHREA